MKKPPSKTLYLYLRRKRLEVGLSQRDLSALLGYRSQFVANWERGASSPPAHILRQLVAILQIPADEILEILYEESLSYWRSVLAPPRRKRASNKKKT